jgi:hypothetical protein
MAWMIHTESQENYMKHPLRLAMLFGLSLLLATACVNLHGRFRIEPGIEYTKLLIGTIQYEAHGWNYNLDGVHYKGLSFTIQNKKTNTTYIVQQDAAERYFYLSSAAPGVYRIIKAEYKLDNGSFLYLNEPNFTFEIKDGVVNNLGVIKWLADKTNSKWAFESVGNHDEVKRLFQKRNPKSGWLGLDWENTPVSYY